jgi:hypothetical protein
MRYRLESLEARCLLSVTAFGAPIHVAASPIDAPTAVEVADVDGDGVNDLFVSTYRGHQWMRQTADRFERLAAPFGSTVGGLADMNGDGSLDVVSLGFRGLEVFLNDGQGVYQAVAAKRDLWTLIRARRIQLVDLDQDGDVDVTLVARDLQRRLTGLGWLANDGKGNLGAFQGLVPLSDVFAGRFSDGVAGDLDGDGDIDLVTMDSLRPLPGQLVVWHERTADGYIAREVPLPAVLERDSALSLADADGDGIANLIIELSSGDGITRVFVMRSDANTRNFVPMSEYTMGADASSLKFADMDGDGDRDVVRSRDARIDWFPRAVDGSFPNESVPIATLNGIVNGFSVGDIDRDGTLDVAAVSSDFDFIAVYHNSGGRLFRENIVTVASLNEVEQVVAADFNGDRNVDLVTRGRRLSWMAGDGTGRFGPAQTLAPVEMISVSVQDIDGDADLDVAASDGRNLFWLKNDGTGVVQSHTLGAGGNVVLDIDWDGDGDLDLVTTSTRFTDAGAVLWWYKNDGRGGFDEPEFSFDKVVDSLQRVHVRDTRFKLGVLVERFAYDVWGVLLIGTRADGSAFASAAIDRIDADDTRMDFAAADTDQDGFDEIVTVIDGDEWFRQAWFDVTPAGVEQRRFSKLVASLDREQLRNVDYVAPRAGWIGLVSNALFDLRRRFYRYGLFPDSPLEFADLNGDQQLDVVAARDAALFWIQNVSAQHDWNVDNRIDANDVDLLAAAIQAGDSDLSFDVNNDRVVDALDLRALVQDRLASPPADVNLDGVFDSADLVQIFQAGKYETDQTALWSAGDFNSDGRFDSADLVVALQSGYQGGDDD